MTEDELMAYMSSPPVNSHYSAAELIRKMAGEPGPAKYYPTWAYGPVFTEKEEEQ